MPMLDPLPVVPALPGVTLWLPDLPTPQALLPRVVDGRLPGLGASERAALVSTLGQSDLDAHAFETKLRLLVNDAVFFEAAAS